MPRKQERSNSRRSAGLRSATAVLLACVVASSPGAADGPAAEGTLRAAVDPDWGASTIWNDGKREIAVYDAQRIVDGEPRSHEVTVATSKEDFTREHWTRADWPYGAKPIVAVMQQHQLAEIPAGGTPSHLMTTVVADRADVSRCFKLVVSMQESAGSTFKEFQLWRDIPAMRFSSFRDGEGTGERTLPSHSPGTHFEEELPLIVRALKFEEGLQARFGLEPNQTTSKAAAFAPSPAILTVVRPADAVATGIGTFGGEAVWIVVVEAKDGRALDFLVESAPPNRLLSWSHGDGRRYSIKQVERK